MRPSYTNATQLHQCGPVTPMRQSYTNATQLHQCDPVPQRQGYMARAPNHSLDGTGSRPYRWWRGPQTTPLMARTPDHTLDGAGPRPHPWWRGPQTTPLMARAPDHTFDGAGPRPHLWWRGPQTTLLNTPGNATVDTLNTQNLVWTYGSILAGTPSVPSKTIVQNLWILDPSIDFSINGTEHWQLV